MAKLPKYNSIRLFNKLAKIAREEFIAQGKEAKWNDIQKWTSKNLFQEFKGTNYNKLDKSKVLDKVKGIIKPIKKVSNCFNPLTINKGDRVFTEWWNISNTLDALPKNLKIRINAENLGITKIDFISNLDYDVDISYIVENIREAYENSSAPIFVGAIRVAPDEKNDGKPCSYFIDFILTGPNDDTPTDDTPIIATTSLKDDVERIERIKNAEREKARKKREKLKEAKQRKRPTTTKTVKPTAKKKATTKAKATPKAKPKPTSKKEKTINKNVTIDLNKELDALRQDVKDGLLTKEEYREERAKLIDKFEKGGIV
jgi:hypothetical protein